MQPLDITKCARPVLILNDDDQYPLSIGGTGIVVLFRLVRFCHLHSLAKAVRRRAMAWRYLGDRMVTLDNLANSFILELRANRCSRSRVHKSARSPATDDPVPETRCS